MTVDEACGVPDLEPVGAGEVDGGVSSDESEQEVVEMEVDDDLATTIMKELLDETYVCLMCTCEIEHESKMWSCTSCYRVYHMDCIESWAKKGSSTDVKGNWKCPSCNVKHRRQKFQYRCWCKKTVNPQFNELAPGSCGNSCGVKLKSCIHNCSLQCHPGPHATCNALGPLIKCHCGNHEDQWPCVITPYVNGWHCKDVCTEYLPCEVHKCNKVCHDGLCGKCELFIDSVCYCGRTHDKIKCYLKRPKKSFIPEKFGEFKCGLSTEVFYDCNNHSELKQCQPVYKKKLHCPLSPDKITTCPCGQTKIDASERKTCLDPIPTCDKICNKQLKCGHRCKFKCHEGDCSNCNEFLVTDCRCGFEKFTVSCKFLQDGNQPICSRKCSALLSCRRHRCNERCCAFEKTAIDRERIRKKSIRNNVSNPSNSTESENFNVEAKHICLQICNKKLSCGNEDHRCKITCHAGKCPPCLESSADDLVCNCGKTVVPAPVRCGTKLPPCPYQCVRSLSCGHDQMPHNCHEDNVACPKCTKSVLKTCNCGKCDDIKAMCYQTEVFCLKECGKELQCKHHCHKICHNTRNPENVCKCSSICGKKKKYCNHIDKTKCHYPEPCNDTTPCDILVRLTCRCGRIVRNLPCGANNENESQMDKLLDCEISCVLQERQEQLAKAFGKELKISNNDEALKQYDFEKIVKVYKRQKAWCQNIETIMSNFMKSDRISMSFKPMRREQRVFIHELTDVYNLYSESQDSEPNRSVFIKKVENSAIPKYSLEECLNSYESSLNTMNSVPEELSENNAILIEDLVIGVTRIDLEDVLIPIFNSTKLVKSITVKPYESDKYLIVPEAFLILKKSQEAEIVSIFENIKQTLKSKFLANSIKLVKIDESYSIVNNQQQPQN